MSLAHRNQVCDFVDTAITNMLRIEVNLRRLGYVFANPQGPVQLAPGGANTALIELQQRIGQLPDLFIALYSRAKCIDFSQDKRQLLDRQDHPVAGLGLNCTLVFESISTAPERQATLEGNHFSCMKPSGDLFFPLGTYASNSQPKGVWLPDTSIDPVIYDAGAGPVTMSKEITLALRAGGFPFWGHMFAKRRVTSPIQNMPQYRGILPSLMEGVVPM